MKPKKGPPAIVGWREWVGLPELGVAWIKAKVDTGARSSSIHGIRMKTFLREGQEWVAFDVHPHQRSVADTLRVEAPILEYREVRSSTGHASRRPVIETGVRLHGQVVPMEITIADRDAMGFRMLLGRQGLRGRVLVDPGKSYKSEKPAKEWILRRKRGVSK